MTFPPSAGLLVQRICSFVFPGRVIHQRKMSECYLAISFIFEVIKSPPAFATAGAGRVIAREHEERHAPRISREGVVFREPPDKAGTRVQRASASLNGNHSAGRRVNYLTDYRRLKAMGGAGPF